MNATTSLNDAKARLREIEEELPALRAAEAEAKRALDAERSKFVKAADKGPRSAAYRAADKARAEHDAAAKDLAELRGEHEALLSVFGQLGHGRRGRDGNGPRSGDFGEGRGWAHAARELSIADGRLRVDMPTRDLLAAGFNVTPGEGLTAPAIPVPGLMQKAQARQFLFTAFPPGEVEPGDLALTEWRQSGSRSVTGSVERDPVSTGEKAKLELSVELATPSLKQWAAFVDEVPSKLFDAVEAFQAFLESELAYQLQLAVDAHCLAQIETAAPPAGSEGATLIEQVRNAIAAMRGLGANPTVLALNPTDAAALDVQKSGSEANQQYVFATRATGSSSPLFGCNVVEVANLEAPTLVDPALAGVLYLGDAAVLADPFSGMTENTVRIRCEADGLLHIRDIAGLYVIEGGE